MTGLSYVVVCVWERGGGKTLCQSKANSNDMEIECSRVVVGVSGLEVVRGGGGTCRSALWECLWECL